MMVFMTCPLLPAGDDVELHAGQSLAKFVGQLVLCLVGGIAAQHGKVESTGLIKGSLRPIAAQLSARPGVLGPSLGVADC